MVLREKDSDLLTSGLLTAVGLILLTVGVTRFGSGESLRPDGTIVVVCLLFALAIGGRIQLEHRRHRSGLHMGEDPSLSGAAVIKRLLPSLVPLLALPYGFSAIDLCYFGSAILVVGIAGVILSRLAVPSAAESARLGDRPRTGD